MKQPSQRVGSKGALELITQSNKLQLPLFEEALGKGGLLCNDTKYFVFSISEHMLKVKETYCTITNLLPNTQYEFWVSALNASGISPPSERAVYVTGKCILLI